MTRLDDTDRRLLSLLQQDGRASVRDLAARLNVSRANAYQRLSRLETAGVLLGYTIDIDPVALGAALPAYIHVRIRQNTWKAFKDKVWLFPEVVDVALVSGEFDCVLLTRTRDADHLRRLVLEQVQALPEVIATQSVLAFEHERRDLSAAPREHAPVSD